MDKMEPKISGIYTSSTGLQIIETQAPIEPANAFPDLPVSAQWWRDTTDLTQTLTEAALQAAEIERKRIEVASKMMQDNTTGKTTTATGRKKKGKATCDSAAQANDQRGRMKNPESWKVNVKKNARLRGEEYIGGGGKLVPAKVMGPPCDCRMRCGEKVDEEGRAKLHEIFWKTCNWDQRKQYIALSVKESPKHRTRVRGKSETRRQITFTYSLLVNGECITVCKPMFLSTFSVSEKFVRHAMDKKRVSPGGILGPDQRGRHAPKTKKSEEVRNRVREHIQSFPTSKSDNPKDRKRYLEANLSIAAMHKHYLQKCEADGVSECDVVKESYYREMFRSEFDYAFKTPAVPDKK